MPFYLVFVTFDEQGAVWIKKKKVKKENGVRIKKETDKINISMMVKIILIRRTINK